MSRNAIFYLILLAGALVAPFIGYPLFLMKLLCFALFACAFNLLIGFTGLLSFGHAMFFGSAAYATAHAAKVWGWTPEVAILFGTACAALVGAVVGALAVRRQGIYFAMITLALSQMIYFLCVQAPFTYAEDGIQSVPRNKLFGLLDLSNDLYMYFFVLAVFVAGFALINRIIHSPFGQVLKSIRENEARALSLGYDVDRYKLVVFILSAALAGLAGSTKALALGLATLTDVTWQMSGEVVLMTLLGGMGTIIGPVVGAGVIVAMQNYLSGFGSWVTIIMGVTFVVCVLAFRRGIVGEIEYRFLRRRDGGQ
ncbi:MAG TPA: branched-chain amino acid ABC transporter permease [Usitatibacteraceae bacterium]|nr:branched-chain amino acid ABC transporter permease [Usitatibacteraceae bacterium]